MNDKKVLYVKGKQSALIACQFVYETHVYLRYKGYFSLVNSKYFSCNKEIENIVESFRINSHVEICTELYAAPKKWLIDNGYVEYQKPIKITRSKKIKPLSNVKETMSS